jgi:hypothetical protein
LLGLALGQLAWLTKPVEALILPLLMIMLTGTFLQVPLRQFGNIRQHGGTAMLGSAPLEGDTRNTHRRDAKDAEIFTCPPRSLRFKSGEPNHPKVEHSPSQNDSRMWYIPRLHWPMTTGFPARELNVPV